MTAKKLVRRLIKRLIILLPLAYLYWPIVVVYLVTGIYDAIRQKHKDKSVVLKQYFFVNGTLTWLLSPLNLLVDLLCLPYINKQIYQLQDLPQGHQKEITTILDGVQKTEIRDIFNELNSASERTMLFYKWYGFNVRNNYPTALFYEKFKYIKTIGVSSFNPQTSTSQHFGWLRAGIRVLINIDEDSQEGAYLNINSQQHVWKTDGPLLIFDDTVLHQSFNLTDQRRNCLFIDIVRPSPLIFLLNGVFMLFGLISTKLKGFQSLSNWEVIK